MPIATPEVYADMLDRAKAGSFAYPAINITSSQTVNAAIRGFAEAGSDGIIQVSTGGAEYASGSTIKNMVTGALALAAYAHEVAKNYPSTSPCTPTTAPRTSSTASCARSSRPSRRARQGRRPADLPVAHVGRLGRAARREPPDRPGAARPRGKAANIILEVEIGVVGGEEDGVANEINDQLYTTPEDALATVEALGLGENGRYMAALTFGNVHGVYKPGNVKLRPEILKECQDAIVAPSTAARPAPSRSTSSSTAAPARCRRRSPTRSTTAS
jgi:fructose-bisphosphate aldolase class II